ncbi:MAG TPA: halocarboxylic acid dehydrogenase DehI family protein [Bacillales bacterium]|nr:halocarboxylic acid dehydrogenase DehI family protein [Bacillales bacterium]
MRPYEIPERNINEENSTLYSVYADIENVLKAPIVCSMFRVLGHYEKFMQIGWQQMRRNLLTFEGKRAAEALQFPQISPSIPKTEWSRYYEKSTIERIRSTIHAFHFIHPKLLLTITAWVESLAGRSNEGTGHVKGTIHTGILPEFSRVELIKVSEAPLPIRALLDDIAEQLHDFGPSDLARALAHYPQFLRLSWRSMRGYVGTKDYEFLKSKLLGEAIRLTKTLPFRVEVDLSKLKEVYSPAELAGLMGILANYQRSLPERIIEGEFYRRSLIESL